MKEIRLILARQKPINHYELRFAGHVEFWTLHGKIGESKGEPYREVHT